jgi:hypothetical protein
LNAELTRKEERIMRELVRMCQDVPPVNTARLAAAVVIRGEVLAWGMNEMRSHPFQMKFGKNSDAIYWHAETRAIHNFIRRHDPDLLQKATIMVARIKRPFERSRDFVPGMARPCKGCFSCIRDFGIPRIAYTSESGAFVCEVASAA